MSVYALKQMIARGVGTATDLDRHIRRRKDRYVLAYHRVISEEQAELDGAHSAMWISPERLTTQIRWMRSVGEIVDYERILDAEQPNECPWFALTFDDGWKDNYQQAFPVLQKLRAPAIIFLATDAVDRDALFWPDDISVKTCKILAGHGNDQVHSVLADCWPENSKRQPGTGPAGMTMVERWIDALKFLGQEERQQRLTEYYRRLGVSSAPLSGYLMSWENARTMQKAGIRFGSHTHNHTIVKGLPAEIVEDELIRSRTLIEEHLQVKVESFCYPNARYNGREAELLARCGYRYGFCLNNRTLRHCTDPYYIPRFITSERLTDVPAYFQMRLLEVPLFRPKPHNPHSERS